MSFVLCLVSIFLEVKDWLIWNIVLQLCQDIYQKTNSNRLLENVFFEDRDEDISPIELFP